MGLKRWSGRSPPQRVGKRKEICEDSCVEWREMIDRVVEMETAGCLRWDGHEFITNCDGPGVPLGLALQDLGRFPPHWSRRKLREHPAQTCRKE